MLRHLPNTYFTYYYLLLCAAYPLIQMSLKFVYLNEEIKIPDEFLNNLDSPKFLNVIVIEISCSSILLLDIILDCDFMKLGNLFCQLEFCNLSSMLISSLITLLYAIPQHDVVVLGMIRQIRLIFFVSGVTMFAIRTGRTVWKSLFSCCGPLFGGVGMILSTIAKYPKYFAHASYMMPTSVYLGVWASFVFIFTYMRWLILISKESKLRKLRDEEIHCTVKTSLLVALVVSTSVAISIPEPSAFPDTSIGFLCTFEYAFLVYSVVDTLYKSHVIRRITRKYKDELEFKRMFVRYISHEIRTPLNTAIMGLQVLSEDLKKYKDSQLLDTTADVKASCDTAVTVLNELLAFDKLESGTLILEKEELEAVQFIKDIIHPFHLQARAAHVSLVVDFLPKNNEDSSPLIICVDRHKMEQVMRNLVSNALKFTPKDGSVTVTISVEADKESSTKLLKIAVTDTGAGISEENQKKLFKEIVQFNPGKLQKGGGSGLGLYIAYGIAKLHSGEITVFSKGEGLGSVFTLFLKLADLTHPISKSSSKDTRASYRDGFLRAFRWERCADTAIHVIEDMPSQSALGENSSVETDPKRNEDGRVSSIHLTLPNDNDLANLALIDSSERINRFREGPFETSGNVDSVLSRSVYGCHDSSNYEGVASHDYDSKRSHHQPKKRASVFLPTGNSTSYFQRMNSTPENANNAELEAGDMVQPNKGKSSRWRQLLRDMRMLIVDDSMPSRKMQSRLLRKHYKECIQAENGQEAVQHIRNMLEDSASFPTIDIIVIDSDMPVLNGPDAIKAIRELGYKGIVIGLTGHVSSDDVSDFLDHGADAVLSKPLELEDFNLALKKVLMQ